MTQPNTDPQIGLEDRVVEDANLSRIAQTWFDAQKERKRLNAEINALGIDDLKDRAKTRLEDLVDDEVTEEQRFVVLPAGISLVFTPPDPVERSFTANQKSRLKLVVPKEEASE